MAQPLPALHPKRIAVVDDSPAVRQSLKVLLVARGYVVDAYEGAEDLLSHAQPDDYDGYVIDLKLTGMDGIYLLMALRQRGISAPAIMITGWELPSLEATALQAGFAALVRKPMMDISLVRVLSEIVSPVGT